MFEEAIQIKHLPELRNPLFIAGFDGWGNALDISRGMAEYLIRRLNAEKFGEINPDFFYRFDEARPAVEIDNGFLKKLSPPGGSLYAAKPGGANRDLIILKASEPQLRWFHFVDGLLSICKDTGVKTIVTLGSMYDHVLHTDTIVSAIASTDELLSELKTRGVNPITYRGPSGIHSTIHSLAKEQGFECIGLWCHCPHYLQGTTHFGLLSHLGDILSSWGGFELDTEDLKITWKNLGKQIEAIIENSPELQTMISDLRKAKVKGSWDEARKHDKVIQLEDFMKPR
jgi:proteasome assembly chaperone (PAC2) family protein